MTYLIIAFNLVTICVFSYVIYSSAQAKKDIADQYFYAEIEEAIASQENKLSALRTQVKLLGASVLNKETYHQLRRLKYEEKTLEKHVNGLYSIAYGS